jgi:5-methylcytosine-specific restriction endonuclease McrA
MREWRRMSARVLRAWRGERGDWCPGYRRPAHRASDLTVDHVVPLAAGGAPYDIANTAVLCRSCNSSKGASTEGGGDRHGRRGLRTAPTQERTLPMPLVVAWRLLTERRAA